MKQPLRLCEKTSYSSVYSRDPGRWADTMRNGKLWHLNYWDVIVQDAQALENIRNYIRFNPMNYHVVMNCGEPKHLGLDQKPVIWGGGLYFG